MALNKLQISVRPRSVWEVFDLAFNSYQRWFWSLLWRTTLLVMPLALVFALLLGPTAATLLIWWLKPLLEQPILFYISKVIFAEPCSLNQSLGVIKAGGWQQLRLMTVDRFSPRRAYFLPLIVLEQLSGKALVQRKRILTRLNQDKQWLWVKFCIGLEMILMVFLGIALLMMVPGDTPFTGLFADFMLLPPWLKWLSFLFYSMAVILVMPLFIYGGFLMYLNRRIQLEGWDLELVFRALQQRVSKMMLSVFPLLICAWLVFTIPPVAADVSNQSHSAELTTKNIVQDEDLRQHLQDIYIKHQLIEYQTVWVPIDDKTKEEQKKTTEGTWFDDFLLTISSLLGGLSWVLVAVFFIAVLIWLLKYFDVLRFKNKETTERAEVRLNWLTRELNGNEEQDWLLYADDALNAGAYRQALAAMLHETMQKHCESYTVELQAYLTEQECLSRFKPHLPPEEFAFFKQLVDLWIALAWAHRTVQPETLRALLVRLKASRSVVTEAVVR